MPQVSRTYFLIKEEANRHLEARKLKWGIANEDKYEVQSSVYEVVLEGDKKILYKDAKPELMEISL